MTGLNLEMFLHLLRADLGAWATLGAIVLLLGLMTWTSWGSRRALRKCLVLSIAAHVGLALYGSTLPFLLLTLPASEASPASRDRIRQIRVTPWVEGSEEPSAEGRAGGRVREWDRARGPLALADVSLARPRPAAPESESIARSQPAPPTLPDAAPELDPDVSAALEARARPTETEASSAPALPGAAPAAAGEVPEVAVAKEDAPSPEPSPLDRPASRLVGDRPLTADRAPESQRPRPELAMLAGPTPTPAASPSSPEPTASSPASPPALEPPTPIGAAATAEQEVAPPEVVRGPADSSPLTEGDLRGRLPHAEDARPVPEAVPGPRPALALGPMLRGDFGPRIDGSGPLAERPRVERSLEDEAPNAITSADPAASGVTTEVVPRHDVPLPARDLPEGDVRRQSRPARGPFPWAASVASRWPLESLPPIALARATPSGLPKLPDIQGAAGGRPLGDVPEVYRSRLDPNRSALAKRGGATDASEQAVERALDWLARHQDTDGRWDGATARYDDGTLVKEDDNFTVHCPPGETCFGECTYWEADTALTGLALLAYLGSGYTQADGKYADTIGRGLHFLLLAQKPDGDLRGRSRAVGMYCHAMATLALCEAYALSGDEHLREPVERAIGFLLRARARDGLAWRYAPGAVAGDTSILGWVVLALKSAKEVGIPVPPTVQSGALGWLDKVSDGPARGLAKYQPGKPATPTMTAEAWVCRQFLGVGGPGPTSTESAGYLLQHGPDRDPYNLYYWYYGTLAMYQHGGEPWDRWNALVRDEVVRRQRVQGHMAGSWDPDDSMYGAMGGRIYCTALATLTLEVYYRFLRLYDEPKLPSASSSALASPRPGDIPPRRAVPVPDRR